MGWNWTGSALPEIGQVVVVRLKTEELYLARFDGGTSEPIFSHDNFIIHGVVAWSPLANVRAGASASDQRYTEFLAALCVIARHANHVLMYEAAARLKDPSTLVDEILTKARDDIATMRRRRGAEAVRPAASTPAAPSDPRPS